MVCQAQLPAYL